MYEIIEKKELAPQIKLMVIKAPEVAAKTLPGNFVIVIKDEKGERIPLTVADTNIENGTLTIIFQEVGKSTFDFGKLNVGDFFRDLVGPLGKPSEIENYGTVVCVAGGVGAAPIYPIVKALKKEGNKVITILGARSKELLILENELGEYSDELHITTDDGSYGRKGFVCDALEDLINRGININRVISIGPTIMMKAVVDITKRENIDTIVSLNSIMVDGTGMCGACRVEVGGETKFTCVDGPEFDGHQVDFDMLMKRLKMYVPQEEEALKHYQRKN
ncbi:sulfide/dihydroorotate dehydrogenase-like FAD/NAD-binding protein [bacterium]|nr:sulfide/dihydroorotate dehydrogenase-like FAD/NAD-binding protein [bacterium]